MCPHTPTIMIILCQCKQVRLHDWNMHSEWHLRTSNPQSQALKLVPYNLNVAEAIISNRANKSFNIFVPARRGVMVPCGIASATSTSMPTGRVGRGLYILPAIGSPRQFPKDWETGALTLEPIHGTTKGSEPTGQFWKLCSGSMHWGQTIILWTRAHKHQRIALASVDEDISTR